MHKNKKYRVNEGYFEKIDTQNKAYFLGLLYADGNINNKGRVHINLQEGDKNVLEKLKKDIEYTGPLHKYNRKPPRKSQFVLNLISHKIVKDLTKIGLSYNKTYKLDFPHNIIPDNLMIHFIRGFFDGDGCISLPKSIKHGVIFSIICLENIAIEFHNFFLSLEVNSRIISPKKDKYSFEGLKYVNITKKKDIFKIMSLFYKDAEIFLDRKYQKYKEAFIDRELHLYEKYTSNTYTGLFGKGYLVTRISDNKEYPSIKSAARDNSCTVWEIKKSKELYKIDKN